ncbi:PTR2-domain-containing protein [Lojkania enalia]|uniref:PTR2-domain-containing protein n=1 Tax=Lojkania enalia TaxID=147567 RepID=A0A9P4N9J1_9PLEO|nr:PTR2-domain-containing protein [Didymosphaeria enalia]
MPPLWHSSSGEGRGDYTSVAQTEDAQLEMTAHGKGELENSEVPRIADLGHHMKPSEDTNRHSLDGNVPTPDDFATLRRIPDKLPWSAFLVAIVELCERFAYYGLSGPLQNYMANKYHDPNGLPGALGLAQSSATALSNFFQLWCYLTPIIGAIVADQYLGKYLTIKYFSIVYIIGVVVLFATSLPISIEHGSAFPGLIAAMFVIGIGTGGIKSNVSPLIAEQVRSTKPFIKTLQSGKRVIVDPEMTVQSIYMIFYMCINVGSISAIATTTLELHIGFWSAYLLPLIMFCIGFFVLVSNKEKYVIRPPQGGIMGNCFKALWIAIYNRFDLDKAKPSLQGPRRPKYMTWDDRFVEELKTTLVTCKVFLFFPLYWVTYSQMLNNFISQAGQMELHGIPNDILQNIDPITIIILIPLLDRLIYPFIRSTLHFRFGPVSRITWGFMLASLAMAYAAILQSRIYSSPPCFTSPSKCEAGKLNENGKFNPNQVHVAWQAPAYILVAISEIFASVTGLEFAYTRAPENMKSFIMSLFLLTSAGGSALGILIAPFARDPDLVWFYAGLGCTAFAAGFVFRWVFGGIDKEGGRQVESPVDEEGIEMELRKSDDDGGAREV